MALDLTERQVSTLVMYQGVIQIMFNHSAFDVYVIEITFSYKILN